MAEFSTGPVSALAISPSGDYLAASSSEQNLSIVPLPHPSSSTEALPLTSASATSIPSRSITAISYPGPSTVYTSSSTGAVTRYTVSPTSPPTADYALADAHGVDIEVTGVAAVSASSLVVTSGKDALVRCWDAETRQSVARLSGHKYEVRAVSVAESDGAGEVVNVVASAGRDKTVRLWDVRAAESGAIHVFSGHTGWVHDVSISGGGGRSVVVSCAGDKTVRLWDLKMMKEARVFSGHEYRVWGVAVAEDGTFAISGSTDASVRAWNLAEGAEEASVVYEGHRDSVISVAVSRDGRCGVSGSEDGSVFVWNTSTLFGRSVEESVAVDCPVGTEKESAPVAKSGPSPPPVADEGDLLGLDSDEETPEERETTRFIMSFADPGGKEGSAELSSDDESAAVPPSFGPPGASAITGASETPVNEGAVDSALAEFSTEPVPPFVARAVRVIHNVDGTRPSIPSTIDVPSPLAKAEDVLPVPVSSTEAKPDASGYVLDGDTNATPLAPSENPASDIADIAKRLRMLCNRVDALLAVDVL